MEFEWDLAKEQANISKHKHTFSEAVEAFQDPKGVQLVDREHSAKEERFYWVGKISTRGIDHLVYPSRQENSYYWMRRMAKNEESVL